MIFSLQQIQYKFEIFDSQLVLLSDHTSHFQYSYNVPTVMKTSTKSG